MSQVSCSELSLLAVAVNGALKLVECAAELAVVTNGGAEDRGQPWAKNARGPT